MIRMLLVWVLFVFQSFVADNHQSVRSRFVVVYKWIMTKCEQYIRHFVIIILLEQKADNNMCFRTWSCTYSVVLAVAIRKMKASPPIRLKTVRWRDWWSSCTRHTAIVLAGRTVIAPRVYSILCDEYTNHCKKIKNYRCNLSCHPSGELANCWDWYSVFPYYF